MAKKRKSKAYSGRDTLKVRIIQGITKAGVAKDQRKEADKKACRKPVPEEDED